MESSDSATAVRVNGKLMGNYINSPAVLMGFITKLEPDGKRATVKTTDDEFVQIVFFEPVTFQLETGTLIEAFGTITSRNSFACKQFVHFSNDAANKLDCKVYDQFLQYYLTHQNRLNFSGPVDELTEPVLKQLSNDFTVDWTTTRAGDTSFAH